MPDWGSLFNRTKMRKIADLSIHEKIHIKAYAISIYGKDWHTAKPNFIWRLNELQVNYILSASTEPCQYYVYTKPYGLIPRYQGLPR